MPQPPFDSPHGPREAAAPASALEYDRLRAVLTALWAAPVKDMRAIDEVMAQLDEAHAAFKAEHRTDDHQRY